MMSWNDDSFVRKVAVKYTTVEVPPRFELRSLDYKSNTFQEAAQEILLERESTSSRPAEKHHSGRASLKEEVVQQSWTLFWTLS